MRARLGWIVLVVLAIASQACSDAHPSMLAVDSTAVSSTTTPDQPATSILSLRGSTSTEASEPVEVEVVMLRGVVVSSESGEPLAGARVSTPSTEAVSDADGRFTLAIEDDQALQVERAAWTAVEVPVDDLDPSHELVVELDPFVVRALRVSSPVAADPASFDELLSLADASTVNALVFDTKDESDAVVYDTDVAFAHELDVVTPLYDPVERLAQAREQGLYTITRIVTFEDATWAGAAPEAKLAGAWVDAANRDNWRYPIDLAVEACRIGFDEVQFDYVRFPSGRTSVIAADLVPATEQERAGTIADFLAQARSELLAEGCAVSAAIFGIVMSSETDERLGQTPETVSANVDAVSPMLYPSHYNAGFLGFDDPNDHPGPIIAHALDLGGPRVADDTSMRPWLQGFYYGAENVLAQINEAEARGAGWIIWNFSGTYGSDWLPQS